MAEAKEVYKSVIRYKGKVNFQGLYELINKFFKNNEYGAKEKKFSQKDSDGKYELNWKVDAERKSTPDFKAIIEVEVNLWSIEKISTIPNNSSLSDGKLDLTIIGKSQFDYNNKFTEGIKVHLGKVYKFVKNPGDRSASKDGIAIEKEIKKFLNMNLDNE